MSNNEEVEYPRFKPENDRDYYDGDFACIHAKFGDFRKCFNFPREFRKKYRNFCSEYEKYFMCKKSVFVDPMQIVYYIERFRIPCALYSNYWDREFADFNAVREWIITERQVQYDFGIGKRSYAGESMDGQKAA